MENKPTLREQIKVILCRQCDGISYADDCELTKEDCPVLQTAPDQILNLIKEELLEGLTVMSSEELEPVYNRCVEDNYINHFASEVAKAQLDKDIKEIKERLT